MADSYFGRLRDDFEALGLGNDSYNDTPIKSWGNYQLAQLFGGTYELKAVLASTAPEDLPVMQTAFGRRILGLMSDPELPQFSSDGNFIVCSSAENNIEASLKPEFITKAQKKHIDTSPVIITKNRKAIAVIKGVGERTCYGLVDDFANGIVRGAFHGMKDLCLAPQATHAWEIDIDDMPGTFAPIRLGKLELPITARLSLRQSSLLYKKTTPTNTHQHVRAAVKQAGQTAQPLSPTYIDALSSLSNV